MGFLFRKKVTDYIALLVLLTTLYSSKKVSAQVFSVDEELTDVALIIYSSALLQNNLAQVLGQMLQNPEAGTRLSWEQAAKLSWLQRNLISRHLSTLSMIPTAQRLLLRPTVVPPEEQLSLILHETCLNYWDDSIPIHSFKISSVLTSLPKALRTVNVFHLVSTSRCTNAASFLDVVFKRLKLGTVFLSSPLLYGLLHTYPFACILPDFQEALDYVTKEIIYKANVLNDLYSRIPLQQDDLKALLLDVLKCLVSNQSPLSQEAKLRIQIILPYLTTETCKYMYTYGLSVNTNYNTLFSALKYSDYPADVRDVKYTLAAALQSKELDLGKYLVGFDPGLYGSNRLSLLLAYLQRLYISLPSAHPASAYVSTLLPYVKFKYIASKGGSYIPRTSFDIAVLLNAFNTIGQLSEARTELYKALTKDIQWESMLHSFPYYKYTDPRSLLISMVQSILSHNQGYKLCHKLLMQYFLEKANNVTQGCSSSLFNKTYNETYGFATISKPIDILLLKPSVSLPSTVTYKQKSTSIRIPSKHSRQNENTINKYSWSTSETPFTTQRETERIKCKVNGTVDDRIKSVTDIFHYLQAEKSKVFPMHINMECIDSNQKMLYLSSSKHPKCNTVTHLPVVTEPKITTTEKAFKLPAQHTATYSLETAPITVKEKYEEITEKTSASAVVNEETSSTVSDNISVESQTIKSVSTLEPTTVETPVFSRLSSTSVEPKNKLEHKSTLPKVIDTIIKSTHEEISLEGQESINEFYKLNTIKANEIGFTTSKSMIKKGEKVLSVYAVQTEEPITEVTIPFQAETTQDYDSITVYPNIPYTVTTTKLNEFGTSYIGSGIATADVKPKLIQTTKAGEHTVEPTVQQARDTERYRQAIISTISHTGRTQTVPTETTTLPDTLKTFILKQPAYTTEIPESKTETTKTTVSKEQIFTSIIPAVSSSTKTSLQSTLPITSSINIFINKTSNITECITLPNVAHILTKLNVSQESVNIIENVILTPEAYRALKYFKFEETELPREILIKLLRFMKYYADLNTMSISIIDEVLYKLNADSSTINEPLKIINTCMDVAGVIQIMLPSSASKTSEEVFWTTSEKELVQTVAEETTTYTGEISTSVPKTTAATTEYSPLTLITIEPLELPLTNDYETVATKSTLQLQKTSSSVTEETPMKTTLGSASFPTVKEEVNKTTNIVECIKVPNITSLSTAIPYISRDSISIIINNILKPEFLRTLKQFKFSEFEVPMIVFTRFLNFIKYYNETSPKVIRAIDGILMDINIDPLPVKLTLNLIEVCKTQEEKIEILLPTMSSLESMKGNISTSGYKIDKTSKGKNQETLTKSEAISVSTSTETFKHLQEYTLPIISNENISINKTGSTIQCLALPDVTFHFTRLHVSKETIFLIENIILTPKVLLALKYFKFIENESLRAVLMRLLNFVKYYAELNSMDIRIIDEVLSKINPVSSFKNEPLRMKDICMDRAGVKKIMPPNVTSLKPLKLSLTTDSMSMSTDKEVLQTVTLDVTPLSKYISTSIAKTTPEILEEPTTSTEPQELTLTTSYKAPDVTTVKEIEILAEKTTAKTKEMTTSEPEIPFTTTSIESPGMSTMTGYKTMTTKDEDVQTVTKKVISQIEPISTSVPEKTKVNEMSLFFTKPLEFSLITSYNTSHVTNDKETTHTVTEGTMAHTEEVFTQTTALIMDETSSTSLKPHEFSLTTGYKTDNEVLNTSTEDVMLSTEKIFTSIPQTTARIVYELPTTQKTGYKAVNEITDKEVVHTVTEDAEKKSTYIPETTAGIEGEMLTTSTKLLELSLITGYKTVNEITGKEAEHSTTEDSMINTKRIFTSISEATGIEDEILPTSIKPLEVSFTTGHKTDKEILHTATGNTLLNTKKIPTSIPETIAGIVNETLPTSIRPVEHYLTTSIKAVNVITNNEVVHTVTEDVMTSTEKISTSIPETTAGFEDEMLTTFTKLLELSSTTGYQAVNEITGKDVAQTTSEDAVINTKRISTSIPEIKTEIEHEMLTTFLKPLEASLITGYKTDKEVVHAVTESAMLNTQKMTTSIPETTTRIVNKLLPTSLKPVEHSLTTGFKAVNVISDKEYTHTVSADAMINTEEISTSISETAGIEDEMLTTSIKQVEHFLKTSHQAVNIFPDKDIVHTVSENATINAENVSTSIPETTARIMDELLPISLKPVEYSLTTTGYKTDKEVAHIATEDAMIRAEKIHTFIPDITSETETEDEMLTTSSKLLDLSLTTAYKAVGVITGKEVAHTITEDKMLADKISTSIPEMISGIEDEMLPTSIKPLTTGYKTDKEVSHTLTEDAMLNTQEITTSTPESTTRFVDEMTLASIKPMELSFTTRYKTTNVITGKEVVQTEREDALISTQKISTSKPETTTGIEDKMLSTSIKPFKVSLTTDYKTEKEMLHTTTEDAVTNTKKISTFVPETTRIEVERSPTSIKSMEQSLTTSYKAVNVITDKELVHTITVDALIDDENISISTPDTTAGIEEEMLLTSTKLLEISLTTGYNSVNQITGKEIVQTTSEDLVINTKRVSTSIPETTTGIEDEMLPTSIKPLEVSLSTGYKTDKEVLLTVTENTMLSTPKIPTSIPETTAVIEHEMLPTSINPVQHSLTSYKAVNVVIDKEVVHTATEDAMTTTEKISSSVPETTAVTEDEMLTTSTKQLEAFMTTDYKAVNEITGKEPVHISTENTNLSIKNISTSIPEITAGIVDELLLTSLKPVEHSLTTGYRGENVNTDKNFAHTVTDDSILYAEKIFTSIPEATIGIEDEMLTTSSKLLELSLITGYKAVNEITGKEVVHTTAEGVIINTDRISSSVPEETTIIEDEIFSTSIKPSEISMTTDFKTDKEVLYMVTEDTMQNTQEIFTSIPETTTTGIEDEISPTSSEFSLTTGYKVVNMITDKESVHTLIENVMTQVVEMPSSTSMPEKTSIKPVTATSTKPLQLSLTTDNEVTMSVPQSEQISDSVMEFIDIRPSLAPVSLPTVSELMNKTSSIVDCIKLPNITSLLTFIPPASREPLSSFLRHLLQPEFLELLKQFNFTEKEAPVQVLIKYLKFIKLYTESSFEVLSAIDDVLFYINNNISSEPLNIMNICINKQRAVETIQAVSTLLEPTTAFGPYITTSAMEDSISFTGQYQMDTTNSPTFSNHTDIITNTQSSPTTEEIGTSIETTTIQFSTEWDENDILAVGANLLTQQHKSSKYREELQKLETSINTIVYPETEAITNANMKLVDHSVASHGLQSGRKGTEIKAIATSVPEYQSTKVTVELDILDSTATTEPETKSLETTKLKQSSLESQNLLGITATSKEFISSETNTVTPIKETTLPNTDIIVKSSIRLETTTVAAKITETESLETISETTYEPLALDTSITDVYSTKSTEKHNTDENFTTLRATSKTMPKIPIFTISSTTKIEDGRYTMEMISPHSKIMSTGLTATQELPETTTQRTKAEMTKTPTDITVIKEETGGSTNTKVTPYESEQYWTTAPSTISEVVTQKTSPLTPSNEMHPISTVSSILTETTTETIKNLSKIMCITGNYSLETNVQMNETKTTLECIKIPDISLLLKANEHLSQDLLNALSNILCRPNVLSLLKNFEFPETSTAANAMRKLLLFLKYNVEPDVQITKVINEIMKNIEYDSLGLSGVVANEICFSPSDLAFVNIFFPEYTKAHTSPTDVSSEMTTDENEQTFPSVTSSFIPFESSNAVEHAKTRYTLKVYSPYFEKEQTYETSKSINTDITQVINSSLSTSFASPVSTSEKSTLSLPHEASTSVPTQSVNDEFHRPTLPNLTNIIHNKEKKAYTIYPYVIEHQPPASWYYNGNIIVPKNCPHENMTHILVIDIISLFEVLDSQVPNKSLKHLKEIISNSETERELKILDWTSYNNKSTLLKDVFTFFIINSTHINDINDELISTLQHIRPNYDKLPTFKFICIPEVHFLVDKRREYKNVTALKITTKEHCNASESNNVMISIPIAPLLNCIDYSTPKLIKTTIMDLLSRDDISSLLSHFNALHYKTNGELLHALLTHLSYTLSLEDNVLKSIRIFLSFTKYDGCSALAPTLNTECINTNEIKDKGYISTFELNGIEHKQTISAETYTGKMTMHTLDLQIEECSENKIHLFVIDMPALFQAVKPEVGSNLQKNIMNILDKPEMQIKLKELPWERYVTKAELLNDVLSYVLSKNSQNELSYAIKMLASNVQYDGPGNERPMFKFICVDFNEIKRQTPYLTIPTDGECNNDSNAVLLINIDSLMQAVKHETSPFVKATAIALFQRKDFYTKISDLKFENSTLPGIALTKILKHLIAKGELESPTLRPIKELLKHIQLDESGARQLEIRKECQSADFSLLRDDLISNEEKKMIIPFQCNDNLTLSGRFTVDIPSLFLGINTSTVRKFVNQIIEYFETFKGQQLLAKFKWEVYETRGQMLKDLLPFVQSTLSDDDNVKIAIQKLVPLLNTENSESLPLVLKFECDTNGGETIKEGNTYCENNSTSLWVVNITSLFKALRNDTPKMPKQLLSAYFSRLDVYKDLLGFNVLAYNTKSELLWKMLMHIMHQNSVSYKLHRAATKLVTYINWDAPGIEKIDAYNVCNITSKEVHLDFGKNTNLNQENIIIKLSSQCYENDTMNIVDMDTTSLIKILPKILWNKIYNISNLLNSSRIKNKLKGFRWDVHHETNNELLREALTLLFKAIPLEGNILNQVDKYIHKMNNIIKTVAPLLSHRCIDIRENYTHVVANITHDKQVHEITGELAIMQPTYGKCPNENSNSDIPIIVVNIANLFIALKPQTSMLAKAIIISHMTHTEFYKQITGFKLEAYRTRGEQLHQLLAFLATATSDSVLLKAIDNLQQNILLDGPGKLPSVYRIVCNASLNQLLGFTRRDNGSLELTDILGADTENVHYSFSVLEPCIEGSSGMTYKIDIPSLFYALKSEAPQESLAKLATFIAKPSFQMQLKNFEVIHHKTQGSLLHAMLAFISNKADTPSYVVQAIENILPFVHSVALGKKTPKITLNCSLPYFLDIMHDKHASDTHLKQGVIIVNQEGLPCNYSTSNSQIIKGKTVYIFDIPSMINILAVTDHEKKLIRALLKSPAFQERLQTSDFRFSTNNAKTLEYMLLLLQENLNLQQNEIDIVQNMILRVREIQEAYIPSVLVMKCTNDTSLKVFPAERTNQTCFLPLQYSHTGIAYNLQWGSLLEAMSPQTPSKLVRKLERFLNFMPKKIHLEGLNIFQYRTKGALLKDLLVFLALKPSLNLEYKKLMSSLIPYVQLHGTGSFAPIVSSDCPKTITQYETESTDSATEMFYTTTLSDPCVSDPNSIIINQFNITSLFTTLDKEAPSHSVNIISSYLQDDDVQEKLHGFDVKKYETKNDLLQGLLTFVWSDQNSPETEKEAAKTLLPHIMFNATEEPPILKTACYVPKKFYIRYIDDIPKSLTLVYPTEKACLHSIAHIPGIIVYRITIPTLFKALHPKLQVKEYLPVANFLSEPYAYKYVQGINIDRYQTRGELLRAVLTFLRFSQKYMEDGMKDALVKMLPLIQLDGLGNLPVDKYTECSLVLEEDKSSSLQLQDVLKAIEQTSLNPESHDAYLTIFDFLMSPNFNLTQYISWLDEKRTLTNGELLKIILLQIYDKNPNMGKAAMLLMPYVEEHNGIGGKRAKMETYKYKEIVTPYEINFLELLKVIKPEAPKRALSYVFNLFGKQDIYKDLKNFDSDGYETQGELLTGILKFLEMKYAANSAISKHVKELIPFVDMTKIGAVPPIVKTIYITFNTSVSVFRLDLVTLYKLFPKEKLTHEQQQAVDETFKFLSTKGYKLPELFQGLSSRFPSHIQIKLILEKLKLMAEEHLKDYANDMLQVLEKNMPEYSSQDELIPEMDWIEVLHAIPDSDVPSEVITSKKELYRFFLSASFKTIIKSYRVNLSISRGKFLKDLLSYLRNKLDVSNIKVLKRAIAYVFMFIREVGAGAMSVQDDIILPEQEEEARSARNRIKELLYQVLGVIQQEGAFEILQTLQRLFDSTTKLNLVTTYLGYDVLEEFPPKERLITILRRIYHNFIMFLDQDTISAIDMVFISLGETKQQTLEILHFLPVDMETLLKTVLGPDTPPLVVAASDFIKSNINLNTIPLGKAFQDTVPSVLNLDVRKRLTVILRILWRVFSKYDDAKVHQSIKTVYEYLQPNKLGNELNTQEHHMAVIAALKGLIRYNSPKKVQNAKNIVIEQLISQQNVYDKVLAYLVTQNLSPQNLIAKALRRFREHQLRMNPKLWSAVSVIFDYLHVPEHETLDEETEGNINIVDEFKYLVDEAGVEVAPAKRILMKYIIDKKPKLHKLFRAQHILLQYPQAEKMAIVLNRLLRIYGEDLEPEIFSAASIILNQLDVLVNEEDINEISINNIFNSVINKTAPKNVIKAKRVIQERLNNATVLHQILQTVIIQKDFTPERQLVTILRQFYNIFKPELKKSTLQFLITLFDYLKVSPDSSVEDQFLGNFTFNTIFRHIFPESEVPEFVTQAVNTILGLLRSEQVDIKQLLYGVHLWKLPVVSQVSIILYRLTKIPYINKEVRHSIDTLLEGLGIDLDELASEDIDESYTPGKLFNEAIDNRSTSPEVQEAKGIIMKFLLSGSSKVKNVYRGIDFKNIPQPKDRLVAVLKNMYNKRNTFGEKMTEALDMISKFLQVDLGKQKIDPYTFDFDGILEQVVPIAAPVSVRQARNLLLKAVKNRPGTFKKILDHVNVTEYETEGEIVSKILNGTQNYNRPLSKHLRIATNLILDYLHGVPIKEETSSTNDYNSKEDAEAQEDGVLFRMFEDEFKHNRKWKIKKKLRRYE